MCTLKFSVISSTKMNELKDDDHFFVLKQRLRCLNVLPKHNPVDDI